MTSASEFERAVAFVGASKAPTSNDTKLDVSLRSTVGTEPNIWRRFRKESHAGAADARLAASSQLYAFYKIASVSLLPSDAGISRPGLFDFAGRAKYDAWVRNGTALQAAAIDDTRAHARARYVEIARERLAYEPGAAGESGTMQAGPRPTKRDEDKTADELLDEDSGSEEGTNGAGMVSVSTMRLGEDEEPPRLRNGDDGPECVERPPRPAAVVRQIYGYS